MISAPFRFDAATHTYTDLGGRVLPHITGLLTVSGWTDERWFDDYSSERGRAVHELTAEYDLGVLDRDGARELTSGYKGYLLAHVKAVDDYKPRWLHVEVPAVHRAIMFGGRPDRSGEIYGAAAVCEIKSGDPAKGHAIQTALQAILVADEFSLPAEAVHRYVEYLKPNGRCFLEQHTDARDFREARRILKRYC